MYLIYIDIAMHLYVERCVYKIAALSFKSHNWLHLYFLLEIMENIKNRNGTKAMYF